VYVYVYTCMYTWIGVNCYALLFPVQVNLNHKPGGQVCGQDRGDGETGQEAAGEQGLEE
jgi:hypothetical protein